MKIVMALLFAMLLTTCGRSDVFSAHGYKWYKDERLPICAGALWLQADPIQVQKKCQSHGNDYYLGCSFVDGRCVVLSMYDEATAATIFLPGTDWSHRQHEIEGHIKNRWSHP